MFVVDAQRDLEVIAYVNGKAVVSDELDNLYYTECEEEWVPVGFTVPEDSVKEFSDLDPEEQKQILAVIRW